MKRPRQLPIAPRAVLSPPFVVLVREWYVWRVSPPRANTCGVLQANDLVPGCAAFPVFVSRDRAAADAAHAAILEAYGPTMQPSVFAATWTLDHVLDDSPALQAVAKVGERENFPASWRTPEGRRVITFSRGFVRGPWSAKP